MLEPEKITSFPPFGRDTRIWTDRRLTDVTHLQTATEIYIPSTVEEHQERKKFAIEQLRLACGFDTGLEFSKLPPSVTGRRIYENVAIQDVDIETFPGLRLTGNLYLPEKTESKLPGIICPHGHWSTGRVHHDKDGGVCMRCFQLARLGFAVFSYDMIGYNENNDLPHQPEAELQKICDLYGISIFGLQCANSIRAVDFIVSLPEVDAERIGCTGASGGGSQTWFAALLDERIKAAAPVCMLSAHFQGGCNCEEGALLRAAGLTNFDIMASLAPRPVFFPSVTGDWTCHNPDYEYPGLKEIYALFGAEDAVKNVHADNCHNYNQEFREYVYAWFMKVLKNTDCGETLPEENIPPPSPQILWKGGITPKPVTVEKTDAAISKLKQQVISRALPENMDREVLKKRNAGILKLILKPDENVHDVTARVASGKWLIPGGFCSYRQLSRRGAGDYVAAMYFVPEKIKSSRSFIIPCRRSFTEHFDNTTPKGILKELIASGVPGMLVELCGSCSRAKMLQYATRDFDAPLDLAFNPSLFSMRVQDILTTAVCQREIWKSSPVLIAGAAGAAEAMAAAVMDRKLNGIFDLENCDDELWEDLLHYQPHIMRIGGLKGLIFLNDMTGNSFAGLRNEITPEGFSGNCCKTMLQAVREYSW